MLEITRRQAAVLVGWSAAALATTAWWPVDRSGVPSRGRGVPTSFGSVAVLGHRDDVVSGVSGGHLHGATTAGTPPSASTHRIDVEVHNGTTRPVLFSPGQFRIRAATDAPSLTLFDAGMAPAALAAGSTVRTWVSYLVPEVVVEDLVVEFTEAGPARTVAVPALGAVHGHGVRS